MSVFLSYSRADNEFVDLLQRLLVSKGYDAWLDRRNIGAGSRWDNEIEEAIKSRSHMVVVLSPESAASQNVADEWNYALDEGKTIVPLHYRECSIPMRLRRLQWIDFAKQPFAEAFMALTNALGEPDERPSDAIELAKREGYVSVTEPISGIRIAFAYRDYPKAGGFLMTVWSTLLWSVIKRGSTQHRAYDYGYQWALRNLANGEVLQLPDKKGLLLHEIGIEPGARLEIVHLKGEKS